MKILILQKSPILCQRLIHLLDETQRYEAIGLVGGVDSVASALQLIALDQPAALLLDRHLDHGGALQMLAALEEQKRQLPVILLGDGHEIRHHGASTVHCIELNKDHEFFSIVPTLDRLLHAANSTYSTLPANCPD